ncbi:RhuM family protein [Bifidobacterium stellenboschense]|uniref:Death-on-curing family protein n=1 Tax=Bifidobacterium stellenboschense TaxID=762211 RepID=A0A087DJI5_9BIFI|nr:RhuM family protein [Bifidobacterium stellenboschense]KFI95685.1 hypothetical protein BSTEL_0491 [Bifidobacterium stellenboschense]
MKSIEELREERRRLHVTQGAVAKAMGTTQSALSRAEREGNPTQDFLQRYEQALDALASPLTPATASFTGIILPDVDDEPDVAASSDIVTKTPPHESAKNIELYRSEDGTIQLEVNVNGDTVWLTQAQMAELFGRSVASISRHITNAIAEGEINGESNLQKVQIAQSDKPVTYYDLDVIISVGYRVKSQRGVQFRRWATTVLRRYLIEGYAANKRRLEQLGRIVNVLARSDNQLAVGIADVVSSYLPGLDMLRDYDARELSPEPQTHPVWKLGTDDVHALSMRLRQAYPADSLLGQERGESVERIIGAIYQSFDGQDLYPTVEEKAAHLLYFMVKDHPFADGNKRMAAALFVRFLEGNADAFAGGHTPEITNNDLAAITLLVAVSDPDEKDVMIDLVERMLTEPRRHSLVTPATPAAPAPSPSASPSTTGIHLA